MKRTKVKHSRAGISLIEVAISTVIVSLIIAGALQTVATATGARSRTLQLQIGPSLARDLMCEILDKTYTDPDTPSTTIGLDAGESSSNRLNFDDVDDYHGWSTSTPVYADGSATPIGAGWARTVSIVFVNPANFAVSATDLGLKRITVTVTSPAGVSHTLQGLRSSHGANERRPHKEETVVTGASMSVENSTGTAEANRTLTKNYARDE